MPSGPFAGLRPHVDENGKPDSACGMPVLTQTKWTADRQRWKGKVIDPKAQNPLRLEWSVTVSWGLISFSDTRFSYAGTTPTQCEMR